MRRTFTILAALMLTSAVFAQSPEKMSYQAVIRNNNDQLVANQQVGMQISILQSSVFGAAIYVETQSPTTNENGLVSFEIGGGTVIHGDFTTIDWSNGPYFIKTETDPTGSTSYTITGTSQLLSVPYALHAKAAETVIGTVTETDPVYKGSQAANITATDISNLTNLSGTNTGDQDLSNLATKSELGDSTVQVRREIPDVSGFLTSETDPVYTSSQAANITVVDISNLGNLSGTNTGDQDLSNLTTKTELGDSTAQVRNEIPDVSGFLTSETDPEYISSQAVKITADDINNLGNLSGTNTGDQDLSNLATKTALSDSIAQVRSDITSVIGYSIGDFAQGGVVFWVDETGHHGLVCAKEDQYEGSGVMWFNGGDPHASSDGLYGGEMNTMLIISDEDRGIIHDADYAALVCANYSVDQNGITYGDWYLPTKYELDLMYKNRSTIDATATANSGSVFALDYYWSSTGNGTLAWCQSFDSGIKDYPLAEWFKKVRAIRAF